MQRLLARLQAEPVLQGLTADQLKQCDTQQRTRIFAALLCRSHTGDKVTLAADLMRRPATQFLEYAAFRLGELGCPHPCSPDDLEHQRAACYRAFSFLADLQPPTAQADKKPARRQPQARAAASEEQTSAEKDQQAKTAAARAAARVAQRQQKGPLKLSPPGAAPAEGRTRRSVSARASRPSSAASRRPSTGTAVNNPVDWVHAVEVPADDADETVQVEPVYTYAVLV